MDIIIGDYEQFFAIINNLEKEKEELLHEIMNLKQELRNVKMNMEIAKTSDHGEVTNIDIMRRLSHLEKLYMGKKNNTLANAVRFRIEESPCSQGL